MSLSEIQQQKSVPLCTEKRVGQFIKMLTYRMDALLSENTYGWLVTSEGIVQKKNSPDIVKHLWNSQSAFIKLLVSGETLSVEEVTIVIDLLQSNLLHEEFHRFMGFLTQLKRSGNWYNLNSEDVSLDWINPNIQELVNPFCHPVRINILAEQEIKNKIYEALKENPWFVPWIQSQKTLNALISTPVGVYSKDWILLHSELFPDLLVQESYKLSIWGNDYYRIVIDDGPMAWSTISVYDARWNPIQAHMNTGELLPVADLWQRDDGIIFVNLNQWSRKTPDWIISIKTGEILSPGKTIFGIGKWKIIWKIQ